MEDIIKFASCDVKVCVNVSIVDDTISELNESFGIHLERTQDSGSTLLEPVDGVVEIYDDESMFYCYSHKS